MVDSPKPKPASDHAAKIARAVWDYGLDLKATHGGRSAAYPYTNARRKKITARIKELDQLKRAEGWNNDLLDVAKSVLDQFFASTWHRDRGLTDFCKSVFHSWDKFERWLNDAYSPAKRAGHDDHPTEPSGHAASGDSPQGHGGRVFTADGRELFGEEAERAKAEQPRGEPWDPLHSYGDGGKSRSPDDLDL